MTNMMRKAIKEAPSRKSASASAASALLWATTLLLLAFPIALVAQTPNPSSIVVQPRSQSVWGGTSVTLSVAVVGGGNGGTLPAISSGTLQLWLRADAGTIASTNGQVSQWQDQSGNGNDAGQANVDQQPVLVYAPAIGGMPAIRFSGVQNSPQSEFLFGASTVGVPNALPLLCCMR